MKNWLVIGGLLGALYGCSSSNAQNGLECTNNYECPSNLVCIAGQCVSDVPNPVDKCSTNDECNNGLICDYGICVTHPGAVPEATWNGFKAALKEGSLDEVVVYFHPLAQSEYRIKLSDRMEEISTKLEGAIPSLESDCKRICEGNYLVGEDEFPIKFMKIIENGKEVWKIRKL